MKLMLLCAFFLVGCSGIAVINRTDDTRKTITIAYRNNISAEESSTMAFTEANNYCGGSAKLISESAAFQPTGYIVNGPYISQAGHSLTYLTFECIQARAEVRKVDTDSWVGVSVEALDSHPIFSQYKMSKTIDTKGLEIRTYRNGSGTISCDNIFKIKNKKVLEYNPTGQCFTDERAQPSAKYKN